MQSTGLYNENLDEIFVGDILEIGKEKYWHVQDFWKLYWHFDLDIGDISGFWKGVKIVGNRFQSPELLEKVK